MAGVAERVEQVAGGEDVQIGGGDVLVMRSDGQVDAALVSADTRRAGRRTLAPDHIPHWLRRGRTADVTQPTEVAVELRDEAFL